MVLREAQEQVKVTKVTRALISQSQILEVTDSVTGKVNTTLTSSGAAKIQGVGIKLTGEKAEVGVYFVSDTGTDIKAATIVENKPSQLIVLIPALTPGVYKIKVVTHFNAGRELKDPRATIYEKPLTVA
jgi:hypothetical protein